MHMNIGYVREAILQKKDQVNSFVNTGDVLVIVEMFQSPATMGYTLGIPKTYLWIYL